MSSDIHSLQFSIIIPVFNEEKLLRRTLNCFPESVLQKYSAELIVSDGGSSDSSVTVARQFTNKIIVHNSSVRQKISEGRNEGAKFSNGDILCFVNADTEIKNPELLFELVSESFKSKNIFAATCCIRVFPEEEKTTDKIFHFLFNLYVRFLNLIGIGMGRGECQIIRKDIFFRLGGYNQTLTAGEDFDMFRRIRKFGKIYFMKNLCVYESPRRYRKYGYIKVLFSWAKNSFSVFFKGKSSSEEWDAIR